MEKPWFPDCGNDVSYSVFPLLFLFFILSVQQNTACQLFQFYPQFQWPVPDPCGIKQQVLNKISRDVFLKYSFHWINHTVELQYFISKIVIRRCEYQRLIRHYKSCLDFYFIWLKAQTPSYFVLQQLQNSVILSYQVKRR